MTAAPDAVHPPPACNGLDPETQIVLATTTTQPVTVHKAPALGAQLPHTGGDGVQSVKEVNGTSYLVGDDVELKPVGDVEVSFPELGMTHQNTSVCGISTANTDGCQHVESPQSFPIAPCNASAEAARSSVLAETTSQAATAHGLHIKQEEDAERLSATRIEPGTNLPTTALIHAINHTASPSAKHLGPLAAFQTEPLSDPLSEACQADTQVAPAQPSQLPQLMTQPGQSQATETVISTGTQVGVQAAGSPSKPTQQVAGPTSIAGLQVSDPLSFSHQHASIQTAQTGEPASSQLVQAGTLPAQHAGQQATGQTNPQAASQRMDTAQQAANTALQQGKPSASQVMHVSQQSAQQSTQLSQPGSLSVHAGQQSVELSQHMADQSTYLPQGPAGPPVLAGHQAVGQYNQASIKLEPGQDRSMTEPTSAYVRPVHQSACGMAPQPAVHSSNHHLQSQIGQAPDQFGHLVHQKHTAIMPSGSARHPTPGPQPSHATSAPMQLLGQSVTQHPSNGSRLSSQSGHLQGSLGPGAAPAPTSTLPYAAQTNSHYPPATSQPVRQSVLAPKQLGTTQLVSPRPPSTSHQQSASQSSANHVSTSQPLAQHMSQFVSTADLARSQAMAAGGYVLSQRVPVNPPAAAAGQVLSQRASAPGQTPSQPVQHPMIQQLGPGSSPALSQMSERVVPQPNSQMPFGGQVAAQASHIAQPGQSGLSSGRGTSSMLSLDDMDDYSSDSDSDMDDQDDDELGMESGESLPRLNHGGMLIQTATMGNNMNMTDMQREREESKRERLERRRKSNRESARRMRAQRAQRLSVLQQELQHLKHQKTKLDARQNALSQEFETSLQENRLLKERLGFLQDKCPSKSAAPVQVDVMAYTFPRLRHESPTPFARPHPSHMLSRASPADMRNMHPQGAHHQRRPSEDPPVTYPTMKRPPPSMKTEYQPPTKRQAMDPHFGSHSPQMSSGGATSSDKTAAPVLHAPHSPSTSGGSPSFSQAGSMPLLRGATPAHHPTRPEPHSEPHPHQSMRRPLLPPAQPGMSKPYPGYYPGQAGPPGRNPSPRPGLHRAQSPMARSSSGGMISRAYSAPLEGRQGQYMCHPDDARSGPLRPGHPSPRGHPMNGAMPSNPNAAPRLRNATGPHALSPVLSRSPHAPHSQIPSHSQGLHTQHAQHNMSPSMPHGRPYSTTPARDGREMEMSSQARMHPSSSPSMCLSSRYPPAGGMPHHDSPHSHHPSMGPEGSGPRSVARPLFSARASSEYPGGSHHNTHHGFNPHGNANHQSQTHSSSRHNQGYYHSNDYLQQRVQQRGHPNSSHPPDSQFTQRPAQDEGPMGGHMPPSRNPSDPSMHDMSRMQAQQHHYPSSSRPMSQNLGPASSNQDFGSPANSHPGDYPPPGQPHQRPRQINAPAPGQPRHSHYTNAGIKHGGLPDERFNSPRDARFSLPPDAHYNSPRDSHFNSSMHINHDPRSQHLSNNPQPQTANNASPVVNSEDREVAMSEHGMPGYSQGRDYAMDFTSALLDDDKELPMLDPRSGLQSCTQQWPGALQYANTTQTLLQPTSQPMAQQTHCTQQPQCMGGLQNGDEQMSQVGPPGCGAERGQEHAAAATTPASGPACQPPMALPGLPELDIDLMGDHTFLDQLDDDDAVRALMMADENVMPLSPLNGSSNGATTPAPGLDDNFLGAGNQAEPGSAGSLTLGAAGGNVDALGSGGDMNLTGLLFSIGSPVHMEGGEGQGGVDGGDNGDWLAGAW